MHGGVGPLIVKRKIDSWGTFAQEVLGQVKENNCKVQLVVVGPVLLPTPGQGEMRDEECRGTFRGDQGLVVTCWCWWGSGLAADCVS